MKANQTLDPIGTICFLPNDNLKEIIPILRETASILDGTWKILIVTIESSNSQMSFKEFIFSTDKSVENIKNNVQSKLLGGGYFSHKKESRPEVIVNE